MNAKEELLKTYPNRIGKVYSEHRELTLSTFDGYDMIDFAQHYAKQKIEEIRNELYEIMPTGKTNVSDMIEATVKAFRAIDEHLKQQ